MYCTLAAKGEPAMTVSFPSLEALYPTISLLLPLGLLET
jgi:hypothetical protein